MEPEFYKSISAATIRKCESDPKEEKFFLTRKGGAGFVRNEEEYEILKEAFEILWSLTENARIEKIRYEITGRDGFIWEIGEFHSPRTKGLFLAEVELPNEAIEPQTPSAVADVTEKDVTDDEIYKNKSLAINGFQVENKDF
jgi:CYTH domain-containing protein